MENTNLKKISRLKEIKELCNQGKNIVEYLTNGHVDITSALDEEISYDIRAGADVAAYKVSPITRERTVERIHYFLSDYVSAGDIICECGCGEGLNLTLLSKYDDVTGKMLGIDISWSRLNEAVKFSQSKGAEIKFLMGDIFSLPIKSDSIDIVYTMQGIYGLGGHEEVLIQELYRVTGKYLILIEPCYEMANDEAKKRMDRLGYVKGLKGIAESLGMDVVRYELFGEDENPLNPASVIVIRKADGRTSGNKEYLCDPITKDEVKKIDSVYYAEHAMLSYPVICGIPCFLPGSAIITTKLGEYLVLEDR